MRPRLEVPRAPGSREARPSCGPRREAAAAIRIGIAEPLEQRPRRAALAVRMRTVEPRPLAGVGFPYHGVGAQRVVVAGVLAEPGAGHGVLSAAERALVQAVPAHERHNVKRAVV